MPLYFKKIAHSDRDEALCVLTSSQPPASYNLVPDFGILASMFHVCVIEIQVYIIILHVLKTLHKLCDSLCIILQIKCFGVFVFLKIMYFLDLSAKFT